jgi:hypothetical protein
MTDDSSTKPDLTTAAVCGLFCPGCSVYIATREHPDRLQKIADRWNVTVDEVKCDGCRADRRFVYCRTCHMADCAAGRGLEFCSQCDDYPCAELEEFQPAMPHRIELWDCLSRIKEVGWEQWYAEKLAHHTCESCGTINSAYDLTCRQCGHTPSCQYTALHGDQVRDYLSSNR